MKITGNDESLAVFMESALIGTLYNDQPLAFEYAAAWLDQPAAQALTPEIPCKPARSVLPLSMLFSRTCCRKVNNAR